MDHVRYIDGVLLGILFDLLRGMLGEQYEDLQQAYNRHKIRGSGD